jgi:hypothetical protein
LTIIVIVHVIVLLVALPVPVSVLNPTMCISVVDDITQVAVVCNLPLATLLRWGDAAGRVPMRTLPMAIIVTLVSILLVVDWICHGCCF